MEITLFPNPFREGVNVILHDYLPEQATLILYDATGQQVLRHPITGGWNTLRLESLAPGMYFYEIWKQVGGRMGEAVLLKSGKVVKGK